jgi:hypothetical protein
VDLTVRQVEQLPDERLDEWRLVALQMLQVLFLDQPGRQDGSV